MNDAVPLIFSTTGILLAVWTRYLEATRDEAFGTISPLISLLSKYWPTENPPGQMDLSATPFYMIHDPGLVQSSYLLGVLLAVCAAGMALIRLSVAYDARLMAAVVVSFGALLLWDPTVFGIALIASLVLKLRGSFRVSAR